MLLFAQETDGGWWIPLDENGCPERVRANLNSMNSPVWRMEVGAKALVSRSRMSMRRSREPELDLRGILAAQGENIDNFRVSRQNAATVMRGIYGLPTIQLNNINVFPKSLRFAEEEKSPRKKEDGEKSISNQKENFKNRENDAFPRQLRS